MNTLNLSCYLVAAILIILALRGLSSPVTSRRGNYFGMLGMAIAIITTFVMNQAFVFWLIGVAIILGGLIGLIVAKKVHMTKMPELVAVCIYIYTINLLTGYSNRSFWNISKPKFCNEKHDDMTRTL